MLGLLGEVNAVQVEYVGGRIIEGQLFMNKLLTQIRDELHNYSAHEPENGTGTGLEIHRCNRTQALAAIPIHEPCVRLVVTGQKEVMLDQRSISVKPGEVVVLPAGTNYQVRQVPDSACQRYHGLTISFSQKVLKHFRLVYGSHFNELRTPALWHSEAPDGLLAEVLSWLQWGRMYAADESINQHRQVAILLLLAKSGLAGNILMNQNASWKQRVTNLLTLDPARSWQVQDVCTRLGISPSSLRRHLQCEKTSFREILEEVRLATGLALLQQTYLQIGNIAEAVGYQSQSRFGERFKRRFGLTPSELRRTRVGITSENVPSSVLARIRRSEN
ncbi:MAG: helix-turn-helix transcriptional regulator [Wenzhouxiangellaceae bacterium]